jgi:hypothetical protein
MGRWRGTVGIVVLLGLAVAGCGEDGDDGSGAASRATTTTGSDGRAGDLDGFVVREGEAPGLRPSGPPITSDSLTALDFPDEEERRLEEAGFVALTSQPLQGTGDGAGISSVMVFATEDGASRELAYLLEKFPEDAPSGLTDFERVDVPDVPGAGGWSYRKPGGSSAADLHWQVGRCVLSLGSEPPLLDAQRAGAKAINARIAGRCP